MRGKPIIILGTAFLAISLALIGGCGDGEDESTSTLVGGVGTEPTAVPSTAAPDTTDGGADTTGGATQTTAADGGEGADIFAQNCASCHGADGTGGVGPDLTTGEPDRDNVEEQVREGGGGMPAFEGQLDDEQIDAVSDYVVNQLRQQ